MTPEEIRGELAHGVPPAVLLLGRFYEVQGLSQKIMLDHKVHPADVAHISKLTADYSRDIVKFAGAVALGPFKGIAVCMDGAAEQAQNILLKVLEEPPESVRFLLYASTGCKPLPAIMSRCQVFYVDSPDDVIAQARRNYRAMTETQSNETAAAKVASAVRAARGGDPALLAEALQGWDEACVTALREWAVQGITARTGFPDPAALRVLEVLARYRRARPANVAAAALSAAFLEEL